MLKRGTAKGFTLIEIILVVAIIALIATSIAVSIKNARIKGRDTKRKGDIKQLQTALEMYQSGPGNGSYPCSSLNCLSERFRCFDHSDNQIDDKLVKEAGIMVSLPADPLAERTWVGGGCYNYRSDGVDYKLRVSLEELGEAGDDGNWYEIYTSGAARWGISEP